MVAFGPDGTAYYANIVFSRVSPASGIVMSTSNDGGATWSQPNMVAYTDAGNFINDKVWMAGGPDGKVVVTWTRFDLGPRGASYLQSPIVGAFSKDGGKTWNRQGFPISDAAHPFDQGSQAQYGPDAALYVAYSAASPTTGYQTDSTVIARSTDDGQTFQTKELSRVYDDLDCYPRFAGRQTLTDMHFRLNSYPSMSIDQSNGNIAIAWSDEQGVGTCGSGGTSFSGTTANKVKLLQGTWATIGSATPTVVAPSAQGVPVRRGARRQDCRDVLHEGLRDHLSGSDLQRADEPGPDRDPACAVGAVDLHGLRSDDVVERVHRTDAALH